jgi:hypothetical protein
LRREYREAAAARRTATSDEEIKITQAWVERAEAAYQDAHPWFVGTWIQKEDERWAEDANPNVYRPEDGHEFRAPMPGFSQSTGCLLCSAAEHLHLPADGPEKRES